MFGPYRLDRLLGRGGMGEVYEAYDTVHERTVALKLLPESATSDEEYRARFRREAKTVATLHEPHVIPIHSYGEIDGRLFLDMRLVVGEDLAAVLARTGPLPSSRAVAIVEQVAAALDAAHASGLVHRDVKPSNVLLTASDFGYLADFGIARSVAASTGARLTVTGATIGTLEYMAPERFTEGPVDARADVYSLACLLHECLTGQPPFPGRTLPSLLNAHLNQPPPRPSARVAGAAALDGVVTTGMAKRPGDRYRSAGELAAAARAALAPFAGNAATEITPPEPTAPVLPRPRTGAVAHVPAPSYPGATPHSAAPSYPGPQPGPRPDRARGSGPPPPPWPPASRTGAGGPTSRRRPVALAVLAAVVAVAAVAGAVALLDRTGTGAPGSTGTTGTTGTTEAALPPATSTSEVTTSAPAPSGPVQLVLADGGPNEPFSGTDQFNTFSFVWNLGAEKPTARSVLTLPAGVARATLGGRIELVANCAARVVLTAGSGRAEKLIGAGFPLEMPAGLPSISPDSPVTIEMAFDPAAAAKRDCNGQVQWDDAWATPA
ncbi:MAG: protein kinase [Pseudonocardia sp.]